MDIDNLVKMANQIARFFEPWADREAARDEVANHLRRFWSPRMRKALIDHVAAGTSESDIAPLVAQAVTTLCGSEWRATAPAARACALASSRETPTRAPDS